MRAPAVSLNRPNAEPGLCDSRHSQKPSITGRGIPAPLGASSSDARAHTLLSWSNRMVSGAEMRKIFQRSGMAAHPLRAGGAEVDSVSSVAMSGS